MGHSDWGGLTAHYEQKLAGVRQDADYHRSNAERLQDEIVALREQMEVPEYDGSAITMCKVDGVEWVVIWDRNNRWELPQVVAIHHGRFNLMDYLTEPPAWANAAMQSDIREQALEIA